MIKRPISEQDQWIVDTNNAVTGIAPAGTGKETTLVSATTDAVTGVITYYPVAGGVPRGFPIILAQSAIPMILPSSGTMGANGALTGLTALPYSVFPQPCFMYFPAGKVFSGSPAGMYYASITSATAATVYNNMYTSGLPQAAIPVVPTPVVDAGPGAYTQATTEITLASITVPGRMMGANGSLSAYHFRNMPNNANNKTHGLKLGSTDLMGGNVTTTPLSIFDYRLVCNKGNEAKQISHSAWSPFGNSTGATRVSAENTAADTSLSFRATLAVATDFVTVEGFSVEVHPG